VAPRASFGTSRGSWGRWVAPLMTQIPPFSLPAQLVAPRIATEAMLAASCKVFDDRCA
jgi:hypothetical protein